LRWRKLALDEQYNLNSELAPI